MCNNAMGNVCGESPRAELAVRKTKLSWAVVLGNYVIVCKICLYFKIIMNNNK